MQKDSLPNFTNIDIESFPLQLDQMLSNHLKKITDILAEINPPTWDNLMCPLEEMEDELERFWSPLSHLHSVAQTAAIRACYEACLPKLSAYESAIGQNVELYQAIKSLDLRTMNAEMAKVVEDSLLSFVLSGVALPTKDKQKLEQIFAKLSDLSNKFENNILDTVNAYELHITDKSRLLGIPKYALDQARSLAKEKSLPGFILTLATPCFIAVMTNADNRLLRETMYEAYVTRASDLGPLGGKFDNTKVINEILALRHEEALLLGFKNYAELSLATKMAESPEQVLEFLCLLQERSKKQALLEYEELSAFAREKYQIESIKPWDISYLTEKKKEEIFAITEETLRPYFPLKRVMQGLFAIIKQLYGMKFEELQEVDLWNPDVLCYQIKDEQEELRGYVYVDLFARKHKRQGAWMDSLQTRYKRADGSIQLPIATVTCNFAKTSNDSEPLLSHSEVETLFHEFGHALHHVLTKVDYLSVSGIHGVEWDAVELPSQFFENWCWSEQSLALLTSHVDTGESIPSALFEKVLQAKNFQSAIAMQRQLEFSLFDFRLHYEYQGKKDNFVSDILDDVRNKTSIIPVATYNRFQHSFSHIFAGGYAAGYYSYKWAELLSSDAFLRFEKEGILNQNTGRDFLHCILEKGGSQKAMKLFVDFRGAKPSVDALLKHNGII